MGTFELLRTMHFPKPREEIFPFFADPENLESITPPSLHFRILTPTPIEVQEGTKIDYRLRLHGIPIRWTSLISSWEPPFRFVDQQIRGPYRQWIHEHRFEEVGHETLMTDRVHYSVPGGSWIHRLFVRPDLERIFDYRAKVLRELIG